MIKGELSSTCRFGRRDKLLASAQLGAVVFCIIKFSRKYVAEYCSSIGQGPWYSTIDLPLPPSLHRCSSKSTNKAQVRIKINS